LHHHRLHWESSCATNDIRFGCFLYINVELSLGTVKTGKFFGFQVILLAALMVMSFFLQNSVFVVWAGIARFLSSIFLVIQLMLIIDFAYNWNEAWVAKDKKEYYAAILGVSVVMIITSVVFWGLFYKWFGNNSSCDLEKFFISFTIILCVGTILLAISAFVEKGGILPSAFVALYSTYLLFVALKNDNNGTCNSFLDTSATLSTSAILGLMIAAGSIVYSTWSIGTSNALVEKSPSAGTPLVKADESDRERVEQKKDLEAEDAPISDEEYATLKKQNIFFHAILILASAYAGMLLTNWGVQLNDTSSGFNTAGPQTMWVNIASQWFCVALFLWTLMAPKCCAGRTWE